jgi:hypothetical protein
MSDKIVENDKVMFKDGHFASGKEFVVMMTEEIKLGGMGEMQRYVHLMGYPNRVHENWLTKIS